jgi:hypothetical protein
MLDRPLGDRRAWFRDFPTHRAGRDSPIEETATADSNRGMHRTTSGLTAQNLRVHRRSHDVMNVGAFLPTGTKLAKAGRDYTVSLWRTGRPHAYGSWVDASPQRASVGYNISVLGKDPTRCHGPTGC